MSENDGNDQPQQPRQPNSLNALYKFALEGKQNQTFEIITKKLLKS